ncbi:MAG TPA: OmpA family protein [Pseudomonas sp.]|jgi:type VI secretion system protein VasL
MTALFEMRVRIGGDPRGRSEFVALSEELSKLSHPACPDVDWARVEQLCSTLFEQNGAELQTAACFVLARSYRHGLDGMAEGVALIEALACEWPRLWPFMDSARLDILGWLFTQLRSLLRSLEICRRSLQALVHLEARLGQLHDLLALQANVPVVALQALRQQVNLLAQRLAHQLPAGQVVLQASRVPEPAFVMPVVILPPPRIPELSVASPKTKTRRIVLWLFAATAMLGLVSWWGWKWISASDDDRSARLAGIFKQEQIKPDPVRLDSLSLFDAGSAQLKPDSNNVLINALINIKAQPGWLIIISGHTDATGDAEQNLRLSHARASAVRDWMQRISGIPASCFAVQGFASSQPIASNDNEDGRAANRRVDIHLVPQTGACGQFIEAIR